MDTFANSEYPEENNPAPEASFDAPQEPQNEAPQEPRNEVPQERQSEPQSGTYHAAGTGRRESPYANSPYMTGQPRPYQYQYQPQTQPPEKREKKPRRSGKSPWKTVVAAVLVVALVASGCLITASGVNRKWEQKTSQITQQLGRQIDDLQKQIDSVPSGTSGALPAADGSAMTPAQLYQSNVDSVVAISCTMQTTAYGQSVEGTSSGSGFILTEDGYVVTNYHVVQNASNITVTTHSGDEYDATVKGYDATNDVAVLKVEAEGLSAATIGSSGNLSIGDMVVAIGNPLGRLAATETVGYVSGINREVTTDNTVISMLQTDAAINPGNSGGALINDEGKVVGITVSSHSGGVPSYSVPIRYLNSLIGDGTAYSPGEYNRNHKPDASRCYSKHYPVPDFGTVTGVTLLGTIREGATTTYYYDREEVEAGDKILLRYYAALGENTFYQFTGGSFTSSSTYPYSVKLYETSYDGIPAISVVVSSNSFASIGGLPQTVDFLCRNLCITPNEMKADGHETYLRPKHRKNREKHEKIK